jgi:hypothetical protein
MRPFFFSCCLLLAIPTATFSQTIPSKIDGVVEPPELTGQPKKVIKTSEAEAETDRQFFEIIGHVKEQDETKSALPALNQFIAEHPDHSDAYFVRATSEACILNNRDFTPISTDVWAANRIFKGIPNFADSTDRWRALGRSTDGEDYYLDVKSVEFSANEPIRLWIKTVGKKETETLAYEMDCKGRRMNTTSIVVYDPKGKVVNSSDVGSGWQRIVPDTIGEQLYNGACSTGR